MVCSAAVALRHNMAADRLPTAIPSLLHLSEALSNKCLETSFIVSNRSTNTVAAFSRVFRKSPSRYATVRPSQTLLVVRRSLSHGSFARVCQTGVKQTLRLSTTHALFIKPKRLSHFLDKIHLTRPLSDRAGMRRRGMSLFRSTESFRASRSSSTSSSSRG